MYIYIYTKICASRLDVDVDVDLDDFLCKCHWISFREHLQDPALVDDQQKNGVL